MSKHRITLTDEDLWHLFVSMSGIMNAGSENLGDCRVTIRLAKACRKVGFDAPAVDKWCEMTVEGWEAQFDDE